MATLTVRTDAETDRALRELTADGTSQPDVIRSAIKRAWREQRYAQIEAESRRLLDGPDEPAEIRAIRRELDEIRAW